MMGVCVITYLAQPCESNALSGLYRGLLHSMKLITFVVVSMYGSLASIFRISAADDTRRNCTNFRDKTIT